MIAGIMLPPSSSSSDDVGAEVAGTGVGAGVGALEVGTTTGLISSTVAPVACAAAPTLLASSLLMALVRLAKPPASLCSVVRLAVKAAVSEGGTATLNSTSSVPLKSLNS